ncbi:MAG: hypothetical protein IKQ40_04840 [Lachnospiraceae bacterium]|nr:hypothetical protein [Lachnospiraceae bacterium]
MNGNDLMNALSGLDPKFIDEAAYELHDVNVTASGADTAKASAGSNNVIEFNNSAAKPTASDRKAGFRKFIYIALPSVAAILLIVGVAFPAIMRVSKSESAAPMMESAAPASDEADEAPAMEEAAEAEEPVAESTEEPAAETAEEPVAEAAEAAEDAEAPSVRAENEPAEETAGEAAAYDAVDEKKTLGPDVQKTEEAENAAPASDEAPAMEEAAEAEEIAESEEAAEDALPFLVIDEARFAKGILTLKISGMTADDISDMDCNIEKTMAGRSVVTYEVGKVSDVMKTGEPLTLDVSSLNLTSSTYLINIGDSQAEFEIP